MHVVEPRSNPPFGTLSCLAGAAFCFLALVCALMLAVARPSTALAAPSGDLTVQAPMSEQNLVEVSGAVNASGLAVGPFDQLKLTGDTALNLDADISCAAILCRDGDAYDLTIQGTGSLAINNNSDLATGIEYPKNLTIESGTVSIATRGTCIYSGAKGDITISGGTVSIVSENSDSISVSGGVSIDNADVYCKGQVYTTGATGKGITIGSGAHMTVSSNGYNMGTLCVARDSVEQRNNNNGVTPSQKLQINGSITSPDGASVQEYLEPAIEYGVEVPEHGSYRHVVMDGDDFPTEVEINGGATNAVKTMITEDMVTGIVDKTFTGSLISQSPVVKDGDYTLVEGRDYTLTYADNINASKTGDYAKAYITGIGRYTYICTKQFRILPAAVTPEFSLRTAFVYDGKPHQPSVSAKVVYNGETYWLSRPTDFVITYNDDCIAAGTHTATMTSKGGNFTFDTAVREFYIVPEDDPIRVTPTFGLKPSSYVYDGTEKTPTVIAKVDGVALIKGEDYDVVFADGRTDIGIYEVTITRIGGPYDFDTKVLSFTISSDGAPMKVTPTFSLSASSYTYDGKVKTPTVTVKVGSAVLEEGADYNVTYSAGRTNAGTYDVTVTRIGGIYDFDQKVLSFAIDKAPSSIALAAQSKTYTGNALAYTGTVTKPGSAGAVTYAYYSDAKCTKAVKAANVKNAGTYYVKATLAADANYEAATSAAVRFTINPKSVTPTFRLAKTAYAWDGKAKTPAVTVKVGSTALKGGTDYTATYAKGRKDVGSYKVKVTSKGNYAFATKTLSFKVNPQGTAAKAPAAAKGALTVKWAKQAKKMSSSPVTGYQVQVATDKAFKKGVKTVAVKGYAKTSAKVGKLKSKKAYYVRVRTYKKVGSATYYSPWSTFKKGVKTK